MKRKYTILLILPIVMVIFALQSCTKESTVNILTYHAFTEPAVSAPLDGATIKITGTTVDLKWATTNADGAPVIADVYFGTSANPRLYKAGNSGLTITVPVDFGATYYWHVTMKDAHGIRTYSPTWSFTVYDPIAIFTGTFNADEPAEAYSYDVSFVKTGPNTIQTANYWNSGWSATFTLDFTNNTYTMAKTNFTASWSAIEAGTIDQATGKMVGDYTIYYKGSAADGEVGVHTYTRK